MNGDPPSIPIITLAGVSSLTNLLPELPLPTPLPQTVNNKSLLYHPRLAAEAQQLLSSRNEALANQIAATLKLTNTDHVELRDNLPGDITHAEVPELLKAVLSLDPDVFKSSRNFHSSSGFASHNSTNLFQGLDGYAMPEQGLLDGGFGFHNSGNSSGFSSHMGSFSNNSLANGQTLLDPALGFLHSASESDFSLMNGNSGSDGIVGAAMSHSGSAGMGINHQQMFNSQAASAATFIESAYPTTESAGMGLSAGTGLGMSGNMGMAGNGGISGGNSFLRLATGNATFGMSTGSPAVGFSSNAGAVEPHTEITPHMGNNRTNYSHSMQEDSGHSFDNVSLSSAPVASSHPTSGSHPVRMSLSEPRVMLEPLNIMGRGVVQVKDPQPPPSSGSAKKYLGLKPVIALTRIEEEFNKGGGSAGGGMYNVVQTMEGGEPRIKLKLSKAALFNDSSRGVKRRYDDTTMAQMKEMHGEFAESLTERMKRRKRHQHGREEESRTDRSRSKYDDDENDDDDDSRSSSSTAYAEYEAQQRRRKERRRDERRRGGGGAGGSIDELMDTPTFKRFNMALDSLLDAAEDLNFKDLKNDEDEYGEGGGPVDEDLESVLSKSLLAELYSEAAKLKSMAVLNQMPYEKLVKVLTILQYSIREGCRVTTASQNPEDTEEEQLLRELTLDRVVSAVDASLAAICIMTSQDMPKEVFLEDVIERVVRLVRTQLDNAIYPVFDPVYRVDPKNKSGIQSNMKLKRARSSGVKDRTSLMLYNKLTELTALIAELVDIQELTDTIILQMSTLSVAPFFVENVKELQLNSLKLVSTIFSKYSKHRQLILEDILSSLARLPTSKKNIRSFRLNADEHIQMVTALALQLIQCVVKLRRPDDDEPDALDTGDHDDKKKAVAMGGASLKAEEEREVMILTSYETAMRTAHNFLAVFLAKCTSKGEDDYRPLFENFVYDLLATVNKPEWPAAELLLSLLGNLLVKQFSNKQVEMSLRVASLDYLGIVAARLRKDAVSSRLNESTISSIISRIKENDEDNDAYNDDDTSPAAVAARVLERTAVLQRGLLEYLVHSAVHDPALVHARQFYIAQWYRDCTMEVEKAARKLEREKKGKGETPVKKGKPARRRGSDDDDDDDDDEDDDDDDDEKMAVKRVAEEMDALKTIQAMVDERKAFLKDQISLRVGTVGTLKSSCKLEYENALLATRYLASNRPFSQSFDIYLTQILKVLCETAVAVRTKALKCLTAVIEADPAILARTDMQVGVHGRFLDQSTAVREAAIELVGKFILVRPELTAQYYDMLSARILDTGISVRKRVIKIFRDICVEQPDFPKISEMCVKMIRRVNDEEGIRKLVNETFQTMWFIATPEKEQQRLVRKVMNISDVVAACRESGSDWLEQLLENLMKKEDETRDKPVMKSCVQIVDCLVEHVLLLEEKDSESSSKAGNSRLVGCFATLYLFCKVKPELLVRHCVTIHPYLDIKCTDHNDILVLHNVTRILELAVPLMDHPSESFLAQLEEDMMKLILKHGMMIVQSCVSCLGAIVNDVTRNFQLVRDCFQQFFDQLIKLMMEHRSNPQSPRYVASRPRLMRALFTVGVLCKHFDFDSKDFGTAMASIRDSVFDVLMYFLESADDDVRLKALNGIGFFVTRHYEFMLGTRLRNLYHQLLTYTCEEGEEGRAGSLSAGSTAVGMCCQVLKNLQTYLIEEEVKMMKADHEWNKVRDKENLKELGDVQSGMASTIIQVYLKQILESFFHIQAEVRLSALEVIILILRQGLVHPVQCVPYLVTMGSDTDVNIRLKADQQLQEIDKKYPGFIQMKAMHGIKMSYRLQQLFQQQRRALNPAGTDEGKDAGTPALLRGVRVEDGNLVSLNSYIYTLIRGNRSQRRALLTTALNMFDDTSKATLSELIYMADNLAYFPYQQQEEPLFIMHQLDIIVSVSGSNILQSFKEVFYPAIAQAEEEIVSNAAELQYDGDGNPLYGSTMGVGEVRGGVKPRAPDLEDEDEDEESLLGLFPEDASVLAELQIKSQGCILLLVLKQHLKDMYGFTDSKIQNFAPTDCKNFEKPVNRKPGVKFYPRQALEMVQRGPLPENLSEDQQKDLVHAYLDFKELMLTLDPEDDDDEENPQAANQNSAAAVDRQQQQKLAQQKQQQQLRLQQLLQHRPPPNVMSGKKQGGPVVVLDPQNMDETEAMNLESDMIQQKHSLYTSRPSTSGYSQTPQKSGPSGGGGGGASASKPRKSHGGGGGGTPKGKSGGKKSQKKKRRKYGSESEESSDDASSDPDWN